MQGESEKRNMWKTYWSERTRTALVACGLVAMVALPATALAADDPYKQPDESWITLTGTVESVRPDNFTLDYGDGMVTVEMDDGDRDADAYKLIRGDEVTVTGRVDDDLFETTTIEAWSVYVRNLGTTFFSSAIDEEETLTVADLVTSPLAKYRMTIIGNVTDVDDHEFTVDSGVRAVRVDVSTLSYDPLDSDGYQKIEVGDRVKVMGIIDDDLFEGREVDAELLIKLHDA